MNRINQKPQTAKCIFSSLDPRTPLRQRHIHRTKCFPIRLTLCLCNNIAKSLLTRADSRDKSPSRTHKPRGERLDFPQCGRGLAFHQGQLLSSHKSLEAPPENRAPGQPFFMRLKRHSAPSTRTILVLLQLSAPRLCPLRALIRAIFRASDCRISQLCFAALA